MPSGIWRNCYPIYSGDDTKIIPDFSLTQYYHTEQCVRGIRQLYWFRRSTCFVRTIKRQHLSNENKGHSHEEYSEHNWCFWHPVIRKLSQDFQQLQEVWNIWQSQENKLHTKTVENKRYHLRSDNDEWLYSIGCVTGNSKKGNINPIKQQTERYVKITNNEIECSFERKDFILETKGKGDDLLKKATRRNRKLK